MLGRNEGHVKGPGLVPEVFEAACGAGRVGLESFLPVGSGCPPVNEILFDDAVVWLRLVRHALTSTSSGRTGSGAFFGHVFHLRRLAALARA